MPQDGGHLYKRRSNKLGHLQSRDIVPVNNTPLPRYSSPCTRGLINFFFMISDTSKLIAAFENVGFTGYFEDP